MIAEYVTIPYLHVEAYPVEALVPVKNPAIELVVVVRLLYDFL